MWTLKSKKDPGHHQSGFIEHVSTHFDLEVLATSFKHAYGEFIYIIVKYRIVRI